MRATARSGGCEFAGVIMPGGTARTRLVHAPSDDEEEEDDEDIEDDAMFAGQEEEDDDEDDDR